MNAELERKWTVIRSQLELYAQEMRQFLMATTMMIHSSPAYDEKLHAKITAYWANLTKLPELPKRK